MSLAANTLAGVELSGSMGGAESVVPIPPALPEGSFNLALANFLYPNLVNRERIVLFGEDATLELFSVTPSEGEQLMAILETDWTARRIPTIESGAVEQWRVEITSSDVTWEQLLKIATVRIESTMTGEAQHYRVVQVENAMKPGHVYHLRCEAIDQWH
jgi:DNA-binding transcriptional regulator YdaS (Cro superfamily)